MSDLAKDMNEMNLVDLEFNTRFVTTNSPKIIDMEEIRDDPMLEHFLPDFKPSKNPDGKLNIISPLAQAARQEVKDTADDLLAIKQGWYHTGTKHQVPHDACYVGRYKDRYAWVCPGEVEELAEFTIKILKFTGLIKERSVLTLQGPRFTPSAGR